MQQNSILFPPEEVLAPSYASVVHFALTGGECCQQEGDMSPLPPPPRRPAVN